MKDYYEALRECARRYHLMQFGAGIPDSDPLRVFTAALDQGCRDRLPIPKLCRWLGYIQGVLIERGFTTVEIERDWTRPLFRPLDFPGE